MASVCESLWSLTSWTHAAAATASGLLSDFLSADPSHFFLFFPSLSVFSSSLSLSLESLLQSFSTPKFSAFISTRSLHWTLLPDHPYKFPVCICPSRSPSPWRLRTKTHAWAHALCGVLRTKWRSVSVFNHVHRLASRSSFTATYSEFTYKKSNTDVFPFTCLFICLGGFGVSCWAFGKTISSHFCGIGNKLYLLKVRPSPVIFMVTKLGVF